MGAERDYGLEGGELAEVPAPELPYRPPALDPAPRVGLVGCGGISETHLEAYRDAGFDVAILCDRTLAKAEARRDAFFPRAEVTTDPSLVFAQGDLDAVDLTPHAADRVELIRAAVAAGVPVLSQKPLAEDLETARELVACAERAGVALAVNQNGRFAPHMAWMREAVRAGRIGRVSTVRISLHWDHDWVAGTPFDDDPDLLLRDFGIHWFDFLASLIPERPRQVTASVRRGPRQRARPPLLGQVALEYPDALATIAFDGDTAFGAEDRTFVVGESGSLRSVGPLLERQRVTLWTEEGWCEPRLEGTWFPGAFHGAMAELVSAVREGREPLHAARGNLRSLELCFAALQATRP